MKTAGSCQGQRIYVAFKLENTKVLLQKYLILYNLREAYLNFQEQTLEKFPRFSGFAELCQKNVLAGLTECNPRSMCGEPLIRNEKCIISEGQPYDLPAHYIKTYDDCVRNYCILPSVSSDQED
jgi:hypothetical protein